MAASNLCKIDGLRKRGILKATYGFEIENPDIKHEIVGDIMRESGLCRNLVKDIYMPLFNYSEQEHYKMLECTYRKLKVWEELKDIDRKEYLEEYMYELKKSRKSKDMEIMRSLIRKIDNTRVSKQEFDEEVKEKLKELSRKIDEMK